MDDSLEILNGKKLADNFKLRLNTTNLFHFDFFALSLKVYENILKSLKVSENL